MLQNIYTFLTNNIVINRILIWLRLDAKFRFSTKQWKVFRYDKDKSIQQNAGFSEKKEIESALGKIKADLSSLIEKKIPKGSVILDMGCGPGIYMKMFAENYRVHGVDISAEMIKKAQEVVPSGKFYCGNFLDMDFGDKFKIIYSISVLQYVPFSLLGELFGKFNSCLEAEGIIFIQYPHALRLMDTFYPNRNYICYSPAIIEKAASTYFSIVSHRQSFDGRKVERFDKNPYPSSGFTFKNGYVLIAKKK